LIHLARLKIGIAPSSLVHAADAAAKFYLGVYSIVSFVTLAGFLLGYSNFRRICAQLGGRVNEVAAASLMVGDLSAFNCSCLRAMASFS
jgi:hypothetical protein